MAKSNLCLHKLGFTMLKRITFGLMATLILTLAAATVVEKLYGTQSIIKWVYGAWWFVVLWGVAAVFMVIFILRTELYKRLPTFLLHVSFVVILLGGLLTYLFGTRGVMHLRQNEIHNYYVSEDASERVSLPFNIKLLYFDVINHEGTDLPADYRSFVMVDGKVHLIAMNKIFKRDGFRLFQLNYDSDEMGTTLLVSHDPWGTAVTYAGYLLLALTMLWILILRIGWKGLAASLLVSAGVWLYISRINPMTPILRTPMLATHVSVIMVAYALFLFIAITSIVGLASAKKRDKLFRLNSKLLYPALFLLTAGIFIGAVWANMSWGRYWGWDAKETWALITMLVYSFPVHKANIAYFHDAKSFHKYSLIAFLTVAMTFFGVTYILGGIHSYV